MSEDRGALVATMEPEREASEREAFLLCRLVATRLAQEVDAVCRSEGLSEPQYAVLWVVCLADEDDGIPVGAIGDGLINATADVSRAVDRLEAAGLVARHRSATDRRVVLVRATDDGARLFARATAKIKALHCAQFAALSDGGLAELRGLLNTTFWTGVEPKARGAAS